MDHSNNVEQLTDAEIAAHTQRVIRPNIFSSDQQIAEHRKKLARAIRYLGRAWVAHPSRRMMRSAHKRRDAIVAGVTFILVPPAILIDLAARGFA